MNKRFNGCLNNQSQTNKLFGNYSKWFRMLLLLFGPITTIQIILFFFPESLIFIVLFTSYLIVIVITFLVETIWHGIKYHRHNSRS